MRMKYIMQEVEKITMELITIGDYIRWGVSRFLEAGLFYGHGTDNAWDEAVLLVLYALSLPADINPQVFASRLTSSERNKVLNILQKRINERVPAAYLTNEAWFSGLKFYIDNRVIIPRSPMAELIQRGFEPWCNNHQVNAILDLCTGSGCIAIACAHAFPEADIDAVDISEQALEVARINRDKYHLQEQVELIQSDLFSNLKGRQYDVIISNPPYVDKEDMDTLPAEYKHEPELALAAGLDGLTIVNRILKQAREYLTSNGLLFVEVGNSELALNEQYPEVPFTWIEFERGGNGVFFLTAQDLEDYADNFK